MRYQFLFSFLKNSYYAPFLIIIICYINMTEQFKRVGDYRFIKRIGKGATSEVFEAKKQGNNERYAIKMISLKGLNQQQREIVNKQVNIIKGIQHPNILNLYDTFETSNNFYLVLQYCERGDLQKYLGEHYGSRIPQQIAQKIIYSIADAVSLIHSKGIAHRDIKLANILLRKDYQIKLADFGFAKQQSKKALMETYCGTPITMAPQIIQNRPYDKKVDIWSLGVIAFQLIYGKLPFSTADGLNKFMQYVVEKNLEIPSQPPMCLQFKELLMCSLQKNPQKRYDIMQFLSNKWVQQGSQGCLDENAKKKKASVQQLLQKVPQPIKIEPDCLSVKILVAQRVNNLIVEEIHKILKKHEKTRQNILSKCKEYPELKNLLYKMDYTFLEYVSKMVIKVGKQNTTNTIKTSSLQSLKLLQPLSYENPVCDAAGNVIYNFLQRIVNEDVQSNKKIEMYQLAYQFVDLIKRFQLRVFILLANHAYEEFEVSEIIKIIEQNKIYEEIKEEIEFTKGNFITLAMQCSDKDMKVKNLRQTLGKNIRKRIDEIKKELGHY